jgi:hypothetical protein
LFCLLKKKIKIWLDRHKSIYHQPSLTKYNPSERRRKRRHRSQPSGDSTEARSKSCTSNDTNDSCEIGRKKHIFFV